MSGTYPNLLAGGIVNENAFAPFELWAGEADLVTSQGTAGANLAQFTVVARAATGGKIVALGAGSNRLHEQGDWLSRPSRREQRSCRLLHGRRAEP
jgi:hypothetical protein